MRYFFCITIILGFALNIFSQGNLNKEYKNKKLVVGEDLTYMVKYAFLRLGEVRFKVVEKTKIRNTPVYKTLAYIDSYPDLPFVSIHQIYESYIDSTFYPLKFSASIFGDDTIFVKYRFIGDSKIEMQKGKLGSSRLWLDSTAFVDKRFQDGLSILFYAMMNQGKEQTVYIPCFVNEKEEIAKINFFSEREPVSIDSVDYEINCLRLDGETGFESVYGLTGYFEGWFSNDAFSIPIIAKMHVLIGNVTLELIKWNEDLWNPPPYKN
jgi:hypothetical protein